MEFHEVAPDDVRADALWEVLGQLRTHLDLAGFRERYAAGHPHGYRFVGLWDGGACRAAAGYRISTSLANGRYLYVDDLVSSADARSKGYGKAMLDHLVALAAAAGCDCITLDSGVHRYGAHRFYLRERFVISSHHFWRGLSEGAQASSMRQGGRG